MTTPRFLSSLAFLLCFNLSSNEARAQNASQTPTQATTWRYDNARTGQNIAETKLTPANVNATTFGKVRSYPVDGYVYAQPLYLSGLTIGGITHNVVFVATEHESVYAFDADHNVQLWVASLVDTAHGAAAGATSVPSQDVGTSDILPEIGITATPVIDPATNTIYVEAKSKENGGYVHRLHALDVTTGKERPGSPVAIAPSIAGTGVGSVNGVINWQPQWQLERPGLLLLNGKVYMAFASHGDNGPYHGWVLGYDAATLQPAGVYNTAPNGSEGGIWESGAGLAADTIASGGRMFIVNGNGETVDGPPYTDTQSYGNAIERLDLSTGVHAADQWTPFDTDQLSASDIDQGSGGILLLPDQLGVHTHELVQVGKNGRIELLDRDNLGGFDTAVNHVVQEISGQIGGLWSTPAYWNGSLYFWGRGDVLKQFTLQNGLLSGAPVSQGQDYSAFPGASPVVTSNGTANGIVWALRTDGYAANGPALLYAYDATNLSNLLYISNLNSLRDAAGIAVKFTVPTVIDGKVFVGAQGEVDVYGLLADAPPKAPAVTFNPAPGSYLAAQAVTLSDTDPTAVIHYTIDGTTPDAASPVYTGPLPVSSTTWIETLAVEPGLDNSAVTAGNFIIGTTANISYSNGFSYAGGLTMNGTAINSDDSRLQLTNGGLYQAGSAFANTPVHIETFISDFTFQLSGGARLADGFTFTLQNNSPHALGASGGGLGYGSQDVTAAPLMPNSIAVKFDLWSNNGEGYDSTGVYKNGASPTIPAIDMTPSGLNLSSGDTMRAHIVYDGMTLFLTITDPVANTSFSTNVAVDIPGTIGSNTAYAGFTAATGGLGTSQKILTWNFWSNPNLGPPQPVPTPVVSLAGGLYTTPQLVTVTDSLEGTAIHYTIDGTVPTASSPVYTGALTLTNTTLLQAVAVATGYPCSNPAKASYIFPSTTPPAMSEQPPMVMQGAASGAIVPVTGDFNGDGKADMAMINAVSGSVSVMFGNGDGSFQAAANYPMGASASWLAAGDFNGDGKLDLAVVSSITGKLTVLLNNGAGIFPTVNTMTMLIGSGAVHASVGDFNGDGHLDLAVTNGNGGTVTILSGMGTGAFQLAATYLVGKGPAGTAVGDLNGDGLLDLIVWHGKDATVGVLLNDGAGSFLPPVTYAVGATPSSVCLGDFNGDGFSDVAVASLGSGTVSVLLNDGSGKLAAGQSYTVGQSPTSVLAMDMNGDGVMDLAVTNQASSSMGLLLGKGDGTFMPQLTMPLSVKPYLAVAADFNGDGRPDLAVTTYTPPPAPLAIGPLRIGGPARSFDPVSIWLQIAGGAAK